MNEERKAVFLSYASQDAEAAKRVCGTLRAAGIEVWFDVEGGLEYGDEWDAKIGRTDRVVRVVHAGDLGGVARMREPVRPTRRATLGFL